MKKILISIKDNSLVFSFRSSISKEQGNLLNTNIISDNELVFSDEYIQLNQKIVGMFIKELCSDKKIEKVVIAKNELALLIIKILKYNPNIKIISIKENVNLSYSICEEVVKNKYIKTINCFSAPTFMLEYLDKYNKTIETRSETFFTSTFMLDNNLEQFSNIYYKTSIRITFPLKDDDIEDMNSFFRVNRYLKNIHINKLTEENLKIITEIIKKERLKNIKVIIHDDTPDPSGIEYLKKLNKKFKLKYKTKFKISYSKEYLNDNIFKQIILNTLKICGLITALLVIGILTYTFISNYRAMKKIATIKEDIRNVINEAHNDQQSGSNETQNEPENNQSKENNKRKVVSENTKITNKDLYSLLSINNDVFGWLTVNNTEIDYPVVQAEDNSYYLNHNFYKEKDKYGWVFMDYRNSKSENLDRNTIMYGHTYSYSDSMFSTMKKTTNKAWYTNKDNQIITFNTLYDNMKFQIFSIYKIPVTTDYLQIYFNNDDDFVEFGNMLKSRSIYDFGIDIVKEDKIITLSTCSGNDSRLIIHAKLIQ